MKKKALIIALLALGSFPIFSQAYIGLTTGEANLLRGPGTNHEIIATLNAGTVIFAASNETQNGFINIIDVETNREGYVHQSLVNLVREVEISNGGILVPDRRTKIGGRSAVEIYNHTYLTLSVKLNQETFTFQPNEKRVVYVTSGPCNFIASAPGVLPAVGLENLSGNWQYSWEFYIGSSR